MPILFDLNYLFYCVSRGFGVQGLGFRAGETISYVVLNWHKFTFTKSKKVNFSS